MQTSTTTAELSKALSLAQGELQDATKTVNNTFFKTKYADLSEVLQTVRPTLSKHGLAFVQGVSYQDGLGVVTTRLMHLSGEFCEETLLIPVVKKDPQGLGSALTYGRRYALAAMVGISQEDDDAESDKPKKTRQTQGTLSTSSTPGTQVQNLIAKFDLAKTDADLELLTEEFTVLSAVEQTLVLPSAKAARLRAKGGAQ